MRTLCLLFLLGLFPAFAAASNDTQRELIRQASERLPDPVDYQASDRSLSTAQVVRSLYADRNFQPIWSREKLKDAHEAVLLASAHGLSPEDYHEVRIRELLALDRRKRTEMSDAQLEVHVTDAVLRLALDLTSGKVDPALMDKDWVLPTQRTEAEALRLLSGARDSGDIKAYLDSLAPSRDEYRNLMVALATYSDIAQAGGWEKVQDGLTLKPGVSDPRIVALRNRLKASGDFNGDPVDGVEAYDSELEDGVKAFQTRHGLTPDGVIGPKTYAELNTPVEYRVNQIRANLERIRWVHGALTPDLVLVNVPEFKLYLFQDNAVEWSSRVVVGRVDRPTPVLLAEMSYLVVNPEWVVPPTILRKDKLPQILQDPGYLQSNNMVARDMLGRELDTATLDFRKLGTYQLVQTSGPANALGQVKFIFPNRHFVFLHDTPSKELFAKAGRACSSGCVRLENPFDLADRLLKSQAPYSPEKMAEWRASGKPVTVILKKKMPVALVYWTTRRAENGQVQFFPDIYKRDPSLISALERPR